MGRPGQQNTVQFTEPRADDPSTPNMDEGSIHQHAEYILLFLFHAFTYTVLTYYGCFLAGKVRPPNKGLILLALYIFSEMSLYINMF